MSFHSTLIRCLCFVSLTWPKMGGAAESGAFSLPTDTELTSADAKLGLPSAAPASDEFAAAAKRLVDLYPAIEFDPALKGRRLGHIDACFQFVRDEIRFESYPGVFRGARVAYASRAANADDRSLLLAEMLKASGIQTRFAVGRLASADAEKLLLHMFDPTQARAATNAAPPGNTEFVSRLRTRALRDYSVVVGAMGLKLPAKAGISNQQLVQEISDHVWLQAKDGDKWVDLDSSFPDAAPGKSYCAADQTPDVLPDARFQRVTIRVIAEQADGGAITPTTLLEVSRPVVDLIDRQIFLFHSKVGGLGQTAGGVSGGWTPVLWIGGQLDSGKPIHFEGASSDDKGKGGGGFKGAFDAFGDAPAPTNSGSQLLAEFLDFQLSLPGGREETVRRTLYDRAGAAWRMTKPLDPKALPPIKQGASEPIAARTIHNIFFSSGRHDMASYAQAIALLNDSFKPSDGSGHQPPADLDFGFQVWPLAIQNLATVLWADQVFVPALNDDPHVRCYLDSPRILLFSLNVQPQEGAGKPPAIDSEMDLRRDSIRAVSEEPSDETKAVRRKVWFGLLEGSLEHEMSAQAAFALSGDGSHALSTSSLLGASGAKLLQPGDASARWEGLATNRETAAKLSGALALDDSLVVPNAVLQGGPSGWWAVSSTGNTRAVLGDDLNGGRFGISGNYIPRGTGGGSTGGGGIYEIDPATLNSRRIGTMGPNGTQKGGGNEYSTLLANVSVPGALSVGSVLTPKVLAAVGAVIAALTWYDLH